MTDTAGLYNDEATYVQEMTVGELRKKLAEGEGFCLHEHQRHAVNQALSQALSLIQVLHHFTFPLTVCSQTFSLLNAVLF